MSDPLDRLVKGAPLPGKEFHIPSNSPITTEIDPSTPVSGTIADPLAHIPSSPPQIYLNLLILEASLRAQWLQLRTRRRQHAFFLTLLGAWILYFGYALFLAPREDGSGVGGSVYWVVEVTEKVCFMGGIVTGILIWGTGQWERGIRWPRRWIYVTNRGLREFNCKIVVIPQPWWTEMLSILSFFFSYGLFVSNGGSSYRYVDHSLLAESEKADRKGGNQVISNILGNSDKAGHEEDLAPGGDYIQLLLLPKHFTPTFREDWETYRALYWEKENERRAVLNNKTKAQDRKLAKERGGWLWWTGYRGWKQGKPADVEKTHHNVHRQSSVEKEHRRNKSSMANTGSHSRNSSRGSTPTTELEEGTGGKGRRGSNASERKKKKASSGSRVQKLAASGATSPLARENSFMSDSSVDSERPNTPPDDRDSIRSSRASTKLAAGPERKSSLRSTKQKTDTE
jgi:hypothetical protein